MSSKCQYCVYVWKVFFHDFIFHSVSANINILPPALFDLTFPRDLFVLGMFTCIAPAMICRFTLAQHIFVCVVDSLLELATSTTTRLLTDNIIYTSVIRSGFSLFSVQANDLVSCVFRSFVFKIVNHRLNPPPNLLKNHLKFIFNC